MTNNSKATEERKSWKKPELRAVSPAKETRGGAFQNDQEDIWYSAS